jgi:parvulin-like peptidyl-prolyl isomerase
MTCRLVVLIAAASGLAAAADVKVVEEIAAKVNADIITRGDLMQKQRELEMALREYQHLTGAQLAAALNEQSKDILKSKIDELLLVQKAKDLQLSADSEVIRYLGQIQVAAQRDDASLADPDKFHAFLAKETGMPFEEFKLQKTNEFLIHRVVSSEVGSRIPIPEAEMQKYYEEHKNDFIRKAQVFLAQILISIEGKTPEQIVTAEAKAKDIVARANKGEKFSDLVAAYSDDPDTARNGGQLPPMQKGQMRPELEKVVFTEKKGFVTQPMRVDAPFKAFAIWKIEERYEEGLASFDEVRDQIQDALATPRMTPRLNEYLQKLRQEAFLQIKDGYVDTGAAPGKDTRWQDVATLRPQTTTKEEVAAHVKAPAKRALGIPIPGTHKKADEDVDTSKLGEAKTDKKDKAGPQVAEADTGAQTFKPTKTRSAPVPLDPIKQ